MKFNYDNWLTAPYDNEPEEEQEEYCLYERDDEFYDYLREDN